MLNNKTIAVVVPAYNEEKQISTVIETMPVFVDRIMMTALPFLKKYSWIVVIEFYNPIYKS